MPRRKFLGRIALVLFLIVGAIGNSGCKSYLGRWVATWNGPYDFSLTCKETGRQCLVGMEFGFRR